MILRPYQNDMSDGIDEAWAAGHRNVLSVLPCAGGKTVIFGNKLAQEPGVSFVMAHRQELIFQISMALAKFGVVHSIQASKPIIKWAVRMHLQAFGKHFYDPQAKCILSGVITLLNRRTSLSNAINQSKLWTTDECFPAGTIVSGRPIESLRVGDTVDSFNEKTKKIETRRITHVFKNKTPNRMMRIDIGGRHVVTCTKGHPLYTKRGWVPSDKLTTLDEVLTYDKLHNVRQTSGLNDKSQKVFIQKHKKGVLFRWLRKKIQRFGIFKNYGQNKQKIRFRKNETEQPYAQCHKSEKNVGYLKKNKAFSETKRGERKTAHKIRKYTLSTIREIWFQITNYRTNRPLPRRVWIPNPLQSGLRPCRNENSDRGRWVEPFRYSPTGTRRTEGRVLNWKRVERVSVQKRHDRRQTTDGFVYNLEVDQTNTYTANGIVAHNCHHVQKNNIWGKAIALFPKTCRGLGVTATPLRADGGGLGRHSDGVFDKMVVGPGMRDLIREGYLSDYRIFAPQTHIDLSAVPIGSTGDFSQPKLITAVRKSQIVGDVVAHYLRIVPGKIGVTFVPDVQTGDDISAQFQGAGVPCAMVHAKTPYKVRQKAVAELARGDLKEIVNVDIFGEGFDLPAIEVCSFGRPTESYGLYVQQFGRDLRLLEGKTHGTIIDHVGNVMRHGLPDAYREWTLNARERRGNGKGPKLDPVRICVKCTAVFEAYLKACPMCGHAWAPEGRDTIEQVEGDLTELTPEALAEMRGEVDRIDAPESSVGDKLRHAGAPGIAVLGAMKNHRLRQEAQVTLRESMALWAGYQRAADVPEGDRYRRFYGTFGLDVLSAQALGRKDAEELRERISRALQ